MPLQIAAILMALGCAPAEFNGPTGRFFIWVCPPPITEEQQPAPAPTEPEQPLPEERPA